MEEAALKSLEKMFEELTGEESQTARSAEERRCQQRYRVPMWGSSLVLLLGDVQEDCRLLNLSGGGMRFRTAAPVEEGAEFRLWLDLQEPPLGIATVTVEVRWVRQLEYGYADVGAAVLESNRDWLSPSNIEIGGSSLNTLQEKAVDNHLKQDRESAGQRLSGLLSTEHWLGDHISALLSSYERHGDIDFASAERMLATEKAEFEKDLAIAKRMFRLYPKLVTPDAGENRDSQEPASSGIG